MCKPCCFQVTNFPLLTFLLPQLPVAKVMLVARVREPRKATSFSSLPFPPSPPLPPPPLQMPVTSYTMRVKTAPCLPAQREGKCSVEKVTFSPVLSLPSSCLALPQGSQAGGEDAARQGGCCSGSLAHLRSVRLIRCGSSAELLTRGAARDYLWRDKAGGHQAGGQPEMSAAKSGSSLGFLGWLG